MTKHSKEYSKNYYRTHKKWWYDWQKEYNKTTKGKFTILRHAAKKRGVEITLTFEEFSEIVRSGICHYCSEPSYTDCGYGVDRVDNRLGYIPDNCVPCCTSCNRKKGALELAGFFGLRAVELLKELLERNTY
jgi:5-methylcytosine-specific restriction endonuclease McrA